MCAIQLHMPFLRHWFRSWNSLVLFIVLGSDKFKRFLVQASWISLDARMTKVIGGKVGDLSAYAYLWLMRHLESSSDLNRKCEAIFEAIEFDRVSHTIQSEKCA